MQDMRHRVKQQHGLASVAALHAGAPAKRVPRAGLRAGDLDATGGQSSATTQAARPRLLIG